jgi:hypothetical protein
MCINKQYLCALITHEINWEHIQVFKLRNFVANYGEEK